jgi:hypothetical protein
MYTIRKTPPVNRISSTQPTRTSGRVEVVRLGHAAGHAGQHAVVRRAIQPAVHGQPPERSRVTDETLLDVEQSASAGRSRRPPGDRPSWSAPAAEVLAADVAVVVDRSPTSGGTQTSATRRSGSRCRYPPGRRQAERARRGVEVRLSARAASRHQLELHVGGVEASRSRCRQRRRRGRPSSGGVQRH